MTTVRKSAVTAGAALLIGTAAACTGAGSKDAGLPTPTQGRAVALDAAVGQYRADEPRRTIQITVTNRDLRPVVVEQVQLVSPDLGTAPARADATLRPGQDVAIRSGYQEVRCAERGGAAEPHVVAVVRPEGGTTAEVILPIASTKDLLDRVRGRECRQQRLAAALSAQLRPDWARRTSGGQPVLAAVLDVNRLGDATVSVHGVDGSVFFALGRRPGAGTGELRLGRGTTSVPIEIRRGRCDDHARSELAERHFVFSVRVALDGGPEQAFLFTPDRPSRERLGDELPYLCGD